MRILITGGAGFLGSHLCSRLLHLGNSVICVDNFITGKEKNVRHLSAEGDFRIIRQDVSKPIHVDDKIDWVLHFASPASPDDYLRHPVKTLLSGTIGTSNCLELAQEHCAKFFLASTSEVYGDPLVHPQPETYWGNVNPIGERSCYDESKRAAEAMALAYHRAEGVDIRIIRIFNTYGENMRFNDGRVMSNFIVWALTGKPLRVRGDGSYTRSFCYVSDLIDAILLVMDNDYIMPINLGTTFELTMKELAEKILMKTGSQSKILFEDVWQDDPHQRRPDLSLAKKLLNWEAKVPLEEGIDRTIAWFKKQTLI